MDDISNEKNLEKLIHSSKSSGYIMSSQLYEKATCAEDMITEIIRNMISQSAKSKLFAYGLISELDKDKGIYYLTKKGLKFESFEKENRQTIWRKYPFIEKLILLIIGATLALIANLLISKSARQSQHLKDIQQDSLIKDVIDSVRKIQSNQIH